MKIPLFVKILIIPVIFISLYLVSTNIIDKKIQTIDSAVTIDINKYALPGTIIIQNIYQRNVSFRGYIYQALFLMGTKAEQSRIDTAFDNAENDKTALFSEIAGYEATTFSDEDRQDLKELKAAYNSYFKQGDVVIDNIKNNKLDTLPADMKIWGGIFANTLKPQLDKMLKTNIDFAHNSIAKTTTALVETKSAMSLVLYGFILIGGVASILVIVHITRVLKSVSANVKERTENVDAVSVSINKESNEANNKLKIAFDDTKKLQGNMSTVASSVEETSANTATVASAAQQMSTNVSSVAASVEEMSTSIKEISTQTENESKLSNEALQTSKEAMKNLEEMRKAQAEIKKSLEFIQNMAGQTNLLALNATIEAARSGEHGKGFAVVAAEVKQLAKNTAEAATEIKKKSDNLEENMNKVAKSMVDIGKNISDLNGYTTTIAAAVHEQSAVVVTVSENVQQISSAVSDVTKSISEINQASQDISKSLQENLTLTTNNLDKIKEVSVISENASSGSTKLINDVESLKGQAIRLNKVITG